MIDDDFSSIKLTDTYKEETKTHNTKDQFTSYDIYEGLYLCSK